MKFEEFLKVTGSLPVIDSENLLAGSVKPQAMKVQFSRWTKQGKLIQLKRGFYLLALVYRKVPAYELYIASLLTAPSYISLEKALEFHNLIPEGVPVFSCVTTKRPAELNTPMGRFSYRHIKPELFWGYQAMTLNGQTGFVASPEKALLDFFYFKNVEVSMDYLVEMRLQNVEEINVEKLIEYAKRFNKPKLRRVAEVIGRYVASYRKGEVPL
jgi:predicted transcriptional regulator of viral defense system